MRRSPRLLFWVIILLTIFAILVNIPSVSLPIVGKQLYFKKGLDLAGGTSITFRADVGSIAKDQRTAAVNAAKDIIEKRINLFGVSEPVIQTADVDGDLRIIVELPGVNIDQAKRIIGTTAQLSFWEESKDSLSDETASPSAYPIGILEVLGKNSMKTELSGSDLAHTSVSFDQNTAKPQVQLKFTSLGAQKFAEITKRNKGKILAIVLDNMVIEAPRVNEPILTGDAVISGSFTLESAKDLSTQLNAGALPVPLVPLQQHAIDPTLGSASLQKSLFAGFLGILIIVVFMSVLYGKLGVLASIALLIYSLFVLSIFKLSTLTSYPITLTLSGIAGFILSIGMAVDANILIFERMKEEIRLGKATKS